MSELDKNQSSTSPQKPGSKGRRGLSPEKKYQLFLEAQRGQIPVGELLRREGIYSRDLAGIQKKVKEAALERLAQRPGRRKKRVAESEYVRLKQELEEKERVMAEMAVELAVLGKKANGGSWDR